jgi:hypothetical protein
VKVRVYWTMKPRVVVMVSAFVVRVGGRARSSTVMLPLQYNISTVREKQVEVVN